MIDQTDNPGQLDDEVDPALADLTEVLSENLRAGQAVDVEEYIERHPLLADSIRQLVPTIRDLVSIGRRNRLES
jgi:hypothetical protein